MNKISILFIASMIVTVTSMQAMQPTASTSMTKSEAIKELVTLAGKELKQRLHPEAGKAAADISAQLQAWIEKYGKTAAADFLGLPQDAKEEDIRNAIAKAKAMLAPLLASPRGQEIIKKIEEKGEELRKAQEQGKLISKAQEIAKTPEAQAIAKKIAGIGAALREGQAQPAK